MCLGIGYATIIFCHEYYRGAGVTCYLSGKKVKRSLTHKTMLEDLLSKQKTSPYMAVCDLNDMPPGNLIRLIRGKGVGYLTVKLEVCSLLTLALHQTPPSCSLPPTDGIKTTQTHFRSIHCQLMMKITTTVKC